MPIKDIPVTAKEDSSDVKNSGVEGKSNNSLIVTTLASMAIISASLVNFLSSNGYPLFKPEIALVGFGIFLLTITISLLHYSQRYLGKGLLEGFLVLIVLNQNGVSLLLSSIAALFVGGLVLLKARSTLPFLGVLAIFTLLAGLISTGWSTDNQSKNLSAAGSSAPIKSSKNPAQNNPALVHIILDEHVGVEGLPADNPNSPAMKKRLQQFYLSRGFKLYGRAYSQHYHTVNSLPQVMNLGKTQPAIDNPHQGTKIEKNAYFDALEDSGYAIHINQSKFLDFCSSNPVESCFQYDHAGLKPIADLASISTAERARLIALHFSFLSDATKRLGEAYLIARAQLKQWDINLPDLGLPTRGLVSTINALPAFDQLIVDLKQAEPGEAYISHILLPHYPYATTGKCEVNSMKDWHYRLSAQPRQDRENAYFDQLDCSIMKMDAVISALSASPAGDNFIMIVHGDHGSRITRVEPINENIGKFDKHDLIAGFSTILAVRANGIDGGYEESPVAVSQIISALSKSQFKTIPPAKEHKQAPVILDDRDWIPQTEFPMPEKW